MQKTLLFFLFLSSFLFSQTILQIVEDNLFFDPIYNNGNFYFFSQQTGNVYSFKVGSNQNFIFNWKSTIGEPMSAQPVIYSNYLLIPGLEGRLYSLNLNTGGSYVKKIIDTNFSIDNLYITSNKLYVSTRNSLILYSINADSSLNHIWTYEFTDFDKAYDQYVDDCRKKGISFVSKEEYEPAEWTQTSRAAICSSYPYVFVYKNHILYKIPFNLKTDIKKVEIGGDVWYSQPICSKGHIYLATTENKFYSINSRDISKIQEFSVGGWIATSPLVINNTIFFSALDGYLYKLVQQTDKLVLLNKTKVEESPLFSNLIQYNFSVNNITKPVILVPGYDGVIRAFDKNLTPIFSFNLISSRLGIQSTPLTPIPYGNKIFIASTDGSVGLYEIKYLCSFNLNTITTLSSNALFKITGTAFYPYGPYSVEIAESPIQKKHFIFKKIANFTSFDKTNTFEYALNPKKLPSKYISLRCRIVPKDGQAQQQPYPAVYLYKPERFRLQRMTVIAPTRVTSGQHFNVSVVSILGQPIPYAKLLIEEGKNANYTYTADINGIINMSLTDVGKYKIRISAQGYSPIVFYIISTKTDLSPLLFGFVAIIILAVGFLIYKLNKAGYFRTSKEPLSPEEFKKKK